MSEPDWRNSLAVDASAAVPLYHQLKERLRAACAGLEPGAPIPSEKELRACAGVGRETVRKALAELGHEGLLYSRRGKGTFRAPALMESSLERPTGFTESMRQLGRVPATRVLSQELVYAGGELLSRLDLEAGERVVVLERLRFVDGEPCMVEQTHLPARLVPGLEKLELDRSLYELLEREYGLQPVRGVEVIVAVNADRQLARLLDVPIASALLRTARTSETSAGRPLEYTLRHARGDLVSFRVALSERSALGDRSVADALLPAGAMR